MQTLPTALRQRLERAAIEARNVAEAGARAALAELAVQHHEPYGHMDTEQRTLRRRLRAHARQLGDRLDARTGDHTIEHLVQETAYEHWHSMLFARFLAENDLLIEPENDVAVTLDECEDLARDKGVDKWLLAAQYAHSMLPQVFRPEHPGLEVRLAREYQLKLESLVEGLPAKIFTAADSLGWVYQFWQTEKKNEVNQSEVKIGADELPAMTQLFTEAYMVQFLLHNSLGAWWETRHPDEQCPVDLSFLRYTGDNSPVAGGFEGWPCVLSEFRLLDPCCGSGHFLVAAFLMLVPMRMALEDLSAAEAVDSVLRDNLHGLELDQRCVAIAAFALAMEAWRYPGAGGYRLLPRFNLAWCGQPVGGKREQWTALARGDIRIETGMGVLYDTFRDAPLLGSLIDPTSVSEDLLTAGFSELEPLLEQALSKHAGEEEREEAAIAALGLTEATRLLSGQYNLVITNVPYLARGKQSERLRKFAERRYARAKNDLATVFLERCLEFCLEDGAGVTQIVMPQNWLFLTSYKTQREHLLQEVRWELLARLGPGAFETITGEIVNVVLLTLTRTHPQIEDQLSGIDASTPRTAEEKVGVLRTGEVVSVSQQGQLRNPDVRVVMNDVSGSLLEKYAQAFQGISPADALHYGRCFWEKNTFDKEWLFWQSTPQTTDHFGGKELSLWFGIDLKRAISSGVAYLRGTEAWTKSGIVVKQMGELPCTIYSGDKFDTNCAIIIPKNREHFLAIWCFCSSPEYNDAVRQIDQILKVTNATLVKIPFDLERWTQVAAERYPNGLPKPYSNDPTQWIFHGHLCGSVIWDNGTKRTTQGLRRTDPTVLQVAVARLLGYRWPAENDPDMELADEVRAWVDQTRALHPLADEDGIVCIPSVRGGRPAHERLLQLLQAAWGDDWNSDILAKLLTTAETSSLDDWLRNRFFEEHCKLFHQRPFIWHIWDGRRRDGFHSLVNYHKLAEGGDKGRRFMESLTYSYLGDWITRQKDGVNRGEGGADDRLAAARVLQDRLIAILEGEPPFDLFIRWKPIQEQPIGWEPDINDGVRLNIRPFMAEDLPGGKKGAGILRSKPKIHWGKDRGKEPMRDKEQFPWFWNNGLFIGDRINDVHWTKAEKHVARAEEE